MPIHYFTEPTDPPTPAPTAALTPPKSPVPVTVSLRRLEVYREEAAPLREYLDGYDSNGQLSRLLLMAAVSLMKTYCCSSPPVGNRMSLSSGIHWLSSLSAC